jgi:hypothetical protein
VVASTQIRAVTPPELATNRDESLAQQGVLGQKFLARVGEVRDQSGRDVSPSQGDREPR